MMTKFEGMQEQINTTVNALQEVEGEKKKNFFNKKDDIHQDRQRRSNMQITGVPEEENWRKGTKQMLKAIIQGRFSY